MDYIQILRGIAALGVVLWHASRFVSPYGSGLGTRLFEAGGVLGVDLFFIISGFIMVHTTVGANACHRSSVWNFFVKRFARIWPLYVIWTLVYVACRHGLGEYLRLEANQLRLLQSFTFIPFSNSAGSYDYPALNIGWTINYEAYFYLIFGLSMLWGRYRWHILGGWLLFSLVFLPQALGLTPAFSHTNYRLKPAYLNIVADPIIWFFAAGILIGFVNNTRCRIRSHGWAWFAVGVTVGIPIWQYVAGFRIGHGVTYWGLSLIPLVLVFCLTQEVITFRGRVAHFAIYLGNISYSLYLVHPLVQEQLERLFRIWGASRLASGFFFMGVTTAASIGLAAFSHRWLENGLSNWLRDRMLIGRNHAALAPPSARSATPNGDRLGLTWWRRLVPLLFAIPLGLGLLASVDWYRASATTTITSSAGQTQGLWSDGWFACNFTLNLRDQRESVVTVTFWNASPLARQLILETDSDPLHVPFAPGEKKTIPLSGVVTGQVTPIFTPGGADTRQLGLHIQFSTGK